MNSRYFHSQATQRFRRNRILGIQNSVGTWVTHPDDVDEAFTSFYQDLFASSNPSNEISALDQMERVVTDEMNAILSQEFMEWEVEVAIKQMAPLKAPGPDGIPPFFYQNYWSLVGDDVSKTILSYLNSALIPHPLNHTFITQIPKIENPIAMSDYRLISLCNVLYKKISKVLAN